MVNNQGYYSIVPVLSIIFLILYVYFLLRLNITLSLGLNRLLGGYFWAALKVGFICALPLLLGGFVYFLLSELGQVTLAIIFAALSAIATIILLFHYGLATYIKVFHPETKDELGRSKQLFQSDKRLMLYLGLVLLLITGLTLLITTLLSEKVILFGFLDSSVFVALGISLFTTPIIYAMVIQVYWHLVGEETQDQEGGFVS